MAPDFSPGQGWHRDGEGMRIPGCENDLVDRRRRAYHCFVMPVREQGERISAERLRNLQPIEGGLLMMGSPREASWTATLFLYPAMTRPVLFLFEAQLVRVVGDCRQYAGLEREREDRGAPKWPQTWICAPTRERLFEIIDRMAEMRWR